MDVTHGVDSTWEATLRRIAADDTKRRQLEEIETRRLRLAAVTVETVETVETIGEG